MMQVILEGDRGQLVQGELNDDGDLVRFGDTQQRVAYLAHPLGSDGHRETNRLNAIKWLEWLTDVYEDIAFVADWILLAGIWPETPWHRVRGLRIDLTLVSRCDEIWLVGGRVSPGMALECAHAARMGKVVVDMTHLGALPPLRVLA